MSPDELRSQVLLWETDIKIGGEAERLPNKMTYRQAHSGRDIDIQTIRLRKTDMQVNNYTHTHRERGVGRGKGESGACS